VLARKPGALRNGAPFKDWVLPASIERVRRKLAGSNDGDRQMVDILTAVLSDGLPAVEAACAEALREGVHSADVIVNILARRREPVAPMTIMTPAALRLQHAPIADCARYDSLRTLTACSYRSPRGRRPRARLRPGTCAPKTHRCLHGRVEYGRAAGGISFRYRFRKEHDANGEVIRIPTISAASTMRTVSNVHDRFPPDVIRHAGCLDLRFTLSYRGVEELVAERGLDVSYETIRRWVLKFGLQFARNLRARRQRPSSQWHLDEMVVAIGGNRQWFWRAMDSDGEVLDLLVHVNRLGSGTPYRRAIGDPCV
jgi:hypothetical protein